MMRDDKVSTSTDNGNDALQIKNKIQRMTFVYCFETLHLYGRVSINIFFIILIFLKVKICIRKLF